MRGANGHQTGAINSHEVIVMPTVTLRQEDQDYAVAFAIPSDTPGVIFILGRQSCDTRRLEEGTVDRGNQLFGGHEALIIFDDVFVPWERVFLYKEYEFLSQLVEQFAAYHRQTTRARSAWETCSLGQQTIAEYNGTDKASHVKDKIVEMNHLNETLYCGCTAQLPRGIVNPVGRILSIPY